MNAPTDDELWRSIEHTVRTVLLPELHDEWARSAAIQLIGVARYARSRRGVDVVVEEERRAIAAVLHRFSEHTEVVAARQASDDVMIQASVVLSKIDDEDGSDLRSELRATLAEQLDAALADTSMLMPFFRGQLPD
jgi:hypothetical protein